MAVSVTLTLVGCEDGRPQVEGWRKSREGGEGCRGGLLWVIDKVARLVSRGTKLDRNRPMRPRRHLRLDASRLVPGKGSRALVYLHATHVVVRSCSYILYILSITWGAIQLLALARYPVLNLPHLVVTSGGRDNLAAMADRPCGFFGKPHVGWAEPEVAAIRPKARDELRQAVS